MIGVQIPPVQRGLGALRPGVLVIGISSLANPVPTASTPTTPTSSTTHTAHSPLRLIPGPPLVSPMVLTSLAPFPRGIVIGPNESAMNFDLDYSSNVLVWGFSEVREGSCNKYCN